MVMLPGLILNFFRYTDIWSGETVALFNSNRGLINCSGKGDRLKLGMISKW